MELDPCVRMMSNVLAVCLCYLIRKNQLTSNLVIQYIQADDVIL